MSVESLDIRSTRIKDTLYIALCGELDMDGAADLTVLLAQIKDSELAAVELDLTGLAYLDSIGLLHIARLYRAARALTAPLTVFVKEGSHIQQILRLIGAGDLFNVVASPIKTRFKS